MSAAHWLIALLLATAIGVGVALLVETIAKRREQAEILELEQQIEGHQTEIMRVFVKLNADLAVISANQMHEIADIYITDPKQNWH